MSAVLPIISIVVPAFNAEAYIERCINSCLSQDITVPFEIIVCDDASSDKTSSIVKSLYGSIDFIHLISNPINSGVAVSRNNCIKNSVGRYIFLLDSDDYIHPSALSLMHTCLELVPSYDIVYSDYLYVDDLEQKSRPISGDLKPIACGQLIKKSIFIKNGLYKNLRIEEEREFLQRCIDNSVSRFYLALPLYRYRQRELSITSMFSSNRTYD